MSKVYKFNGLIKINVCFFKKILIKVLKIILILILLFFFFVYWLFFDMNRFFYGEFLNEFLFFNWKYKFKFYLCNGGVIIVFVIRGELCYKNGLKIRNIYWNYLEDKVDVKWINNYVVIINGYRLDIFKEFFDFRKEFVKRMIEGIIEKNRGGGLYW